MGPAGEMCRMGGRREERGEISGPGGARGMGMGGVRVGATTCGGASLSLSLWTAGRGFGHPARFAQAHIPSRLVTSPRSQDCGECGWMDVGTNE